MLVEVEPDFIPAFRHFFRHMAGLAWCERIVDSDGVPECDWKFNCTSGFVMSIRDHWFLVTAGHVYRRLNECLRSKTVQIHGIALMDSFGSGAKFDDPNPFPYDPSETIAIDDEELGLDLGIIHIRPFYRASLEANGVVAVVEQNWAFQDKAKFEHYYLCGVPDELNSVTVTDNGNETQFRGATGMTMLRMDRLDEPPLDAPKTAMPYFVGRLRGSEPKSIVGMSGGPIIGLGRNESGQWLYWIVGLQSWWYPDRRIIFGCPVPLFAAAMYHNVEILLGG